MHDALRSMGENWVTSVRRRQACKGSRQSCVAPCRLWASDLEMYRHTVCLMQAYRVLHTSTQATHLGHQVCLGHQGIKATDRHSMGCMDPWAVAGSGLLREGQRLGAMRPHARWAMACEVLHALCSEHVYLQLVSWIGHSVVGASSLHLCCQ